MGKTTPNAEIEGYGPIKLGMSLPDILEKVGQRRFNPVSVDDCLKDMPIRGCYLSWDDDGGPFVIEDGIPLQLTATFNRNGAATDIGLHYRREGDISRDECINVTERLIDWAVKSYGPFDYWARGAEHPTERRTPAGQTFGAVMSKPDWFLALPMRTRPTAHYDRRQAIPTWDKKRYAWIIGHWLRLSGKHVDCDVEVELSEPISVERRIAGLR